MNQYLILGFLGVFITAVSQLILKTGATKRANKGFLSFFINPHTIGGYGLLFSVTLINLFVFKYLALKYMLVFIPSTYILVFLLSRIVLKEMLDQRKLIGFLIILTGIVVFNLS